MSTVRVVHYVNQFFAGVGAEEKADTGPEARPGAVGAAVGLQKALGDQGKVVATVFCGDNYITQNGSSAAAEVVKLIRQFEPDVVVAGPAFGSGRYGLACGQVCTAVQDELHTPAIAGMYEESPGAEQFRKTVTIVPTRETAAGMNAALKELARLALKLGSGHPLGAPSDDGYIPRGVRRNVFVAERGAARAVTMLLKKLNGQAFTTEWPLPRYERVIPPAAMRTTKGILIALVAEGGVVPTGNPDRIPSGWATKWAKYDLTNVDDLTSESFETVHGGFDTTAANQDPDRLVPVDVVRQMEKEGELTLYPKLYSTVGNMGSITEMRRLGVEIAKELKEAGVDGVIVGATWGTGTRSGSTLAKELERAGLPTVLVTALSPLAESVGSNRIVRGEAVRHPFGNPALGIKEEREYRRRLVEEALTALKTAVEGPTVFEAKAS